MKLSVIFLEEVKLLRDLQRNEVSLRFRNPLDFENLRKLCFLQICIAVLFLQPVFALEKDRTDCSSIENLLRDEDCNFQKIVITGRVQSPLNRISQAGNAYTIFYLTDGRNQIKVFMFDSPKLKDGMFAEVTGKFYAKRKSSNNWFYNEIQATSVKEQNIISILNSVFMLRIPPIFRWW